MMLVVLLFVAGCGSQSEAVSRRAAAKSGPEPVPVVVPRYYVSLYCYESVPNRAAYSHNFAVFVRVLGEDVSKVSISWMPAKTGGPLLSRQPGRNWSVEETCAYAVTGKRVLEELGPYECTVALWDRAVAQARRLESGAVEYAGLAGGEDCCNCIHAVLNVVAPGTRTGSLWGKRANAFTLRFYRPYLIKPGVIHADVPRL